MGDTTRKYHIGTKDAAAERGVLSYYNPISSRVVFRSNTPEEEFMAHCSNIQAFFENELNTDILHSDIAFPLLKKLVRLGYKPAEEVFNKRSLKDIMRARGKQEGS